MLNLLKLDREYSKTNYEIEKLESQLSELRDHKVRLRYFYTKYYKKSSEVLKNV